jgi:hypothetical protein
MEFEGVRSHPRASSIDAKGQLGVEAILRETTPTIFDWATNEEQASDAAPNTNLPDPRVVARRAIRRSNEENYETRDGNAVKTRAAISCAPSGYEFGVTYQFEYRAVGDSEWTVIPLTRGVRRAARAWKFLTLRAAAMTSK